MIKLNPNPTFPAVVNLQVPGSADTAEAQFTFRVLSRQRLLQLLILTNVVKRPWVVRALQYLRLCWRVRRIASVIDELDEIIAGWDGFDLPYSKPALRRLLQEFPNAALSIFVSYLEHQEEARRKN